MEFLKMLKNKDFQKGILAGLLITLFILVITAGIYYQVGSRQGIKVIENQQKSSRIEDKGDSKQVKFMGFKLKDEDSFKPELSFTFSRNIKEVNPDLNKLVEFYPEIKGSFSWRSAEELVFKVEENLEAKTEYAAWLNKEQIEKKGYQYLGKTKVEFTTPRPVRVKVYEVKSGGVVDPVDNLTFIFSHDIADSNLIGSTFHDQLITLEPAVQGSYRWINSRELMFLPEEPLLPATHYRAVLDPELLNYTPFYMKGKQSIEFDTASFRVLFSKMNLINSEGKKDSLYVRLNFNYPVKPDDLEKHLKLYLGPEKMESNVSDRYLIEPYQISDSFEVTIPDIKRKEIVQNVKLVITPGLVCDQGSQGLEESYIKITKLDAYQPLNLDSIRAESSLNGGTIILEFSQAVEKESVESFISFADNITYSSRVYKDRVYLTGEDLKPGQVYTINLKAGLPSHSGYLEEYLTRRVRIPDLSPMLRFNAPGYYLSSMGNMNLGLEAVNIDQIDVSINRIYANNLIHFIPQSRSSLSNSELKRLGQQIREFTLQLNGQTNEVHQETVHLGNYLDSTNKGVFQVNVKDRDRYWRDDSRIIIITDIGIMTKLSADELLVWVNSLKTLKPLSDARVTLLSQNNQTLAEGKTDSSGLIRFNGLEEVFKEYKPYLVVVDYGQDFSFLHLTDSRIDLADFDVAGRSYLTEGYQAYVYPDRGVYRPGDKANLTVVIRDSSRDLPPEFPVKIRVTDPTDKIFSEFVKGSSAAGALEFTLDLPEYVKTGKYTVSVYAADQEIGSTDFNVEDFMPDRIKAEVETDRETYFKGDKAEITVQGTNLFGPPAAGRKVELAVTLDAIPFKPQGYSSYTFGEKDADWKKIEENLSDDRLDERGRFTYNYTFPDRIDPGRMMKAVFQATVKEEGGRAVSAYQVVDFHPYETYIGLKPLGDYYGQVNQPYSIEYVQLTNRGEPLQGSSLDVSIYRIIWHGLWRRNEDGEWYYETDEEESKIVSRHLQTDREKGLFTFTPGEYGKYKVVMTDPVRGSTSSLYFYASGWGYSPWAISNPDRVELTLDKNSYQVGETAEIQLKTPFAGKALLTVEREKVYQQKIIEVQDNSALISLPVKEEWKPNVYVTVQLIRSIVNLDKHAPVRAFGTIPLYVDSSDHRLTVELEAEDVWRPLNRVDVGVEVKGARDTTYLTLAAVDEGILQLTNFKSPDPFAFFYGKTGLDVESADLYNQILPEVARASGQSSPAGGSDAYQSTMRKNNLNPISADRVKPVSLWSGLVKLDKEGKGTINLDLPQFNGSVRLMAVAFSHDQFGMADRNVIIRDKIVLRPTFPRFIAPGDQLQVPVGIYNGTDQSGEFTVTLKADGPCQIVNSPQQKIKLDRGEEGFIYYQLAAENSAGKIVFTVEGVGNGEKTNAETELTVRPAAPFTTEVISGKVTADNPAAVDLTGKWLAGTEDYSFTLAPFPAVEFSQSLTYLLQYPYGCLEQTTSRVFPLLYFDQLASTAEPDFFQAGDADYYIREGIKKIQSMQRNSGDFSFWPNGNYSSEWGSIYASHFLVEARKAGYDIANYVYDKLLQNLKYAGRKTARSSFELQKKVYALYVLALAGKPDLSSMNYIKNHQLQLLYSDSRALLAAAYHYTGQREEAGNLILYNYAPVEVERETGGNLNSSIRTEAIILSVLADLEPDHPSIPVLVKRLAGKAKSGYWGTTQDSAFAFMAIGKVLMSKNKGTYQGQVSINGRQVATFDHKQELKLMEEIAAGGQLMVDLEGQGDAYYFARISGVPLSGKVDEEDSGITVRREYLDKEGQPLDLQSVKQGEMVVARIELRATSGRIENLAVVDLLPAGLEIENPRLGSRARLSWMKNNDFEVDYLDIRDDRLLLFTDLPERKTLTFYYALRAVTVGDFILPPIKAECMYEPDIHSISSGGRLKVID